LLVVVVTVTLLPAGNSPAQGLSCKQQLSHGDLMLAGGLGGTAFWLSCYPLDVIKSKIQVRVLSTAAAGNSCCVECQQQQQTALHDPLAKVNVSS